MRAFLAILAALAAFPALPPIHDAQEEQAGRIFRVPLTLEARMLADEAQLHIDNRRWSDAIETLVAMVAQRDRDVLPSKHARGGSQFPLYPGAAQWALDELRALPPEALELYRERYDDVARRAFEDARRNGERSALVDVVRRWPLTDGAVLAWWTLGDLELELGNVDQALSAWERGAETLERVGRAPSSGAMRRLAFAEEVRARGPGQPPDNRSGFELAGPGEGRGPVPLKDADPWEFVQMDLKPFSRERGTYGMYPVLADDRVLVSSGLRLFAVDAYSPELLWQAGPPAGWDALESYKQEQLFDDIDYDSSIIAPAVGGGVAVAALQIPYATHEKQEYQGIGILSAIPQRRLFAFDLETGEELWNHAPPLGWDGEFGTYAQRMLVASAPVVAGTRIVVPCYRMDSRIEFQVACYDLATGERLWSTSLVSGQRELNMFGRQIREYVGAPLAVDGDRLFAVTHLGTVAGLDLVTGRIRWQATYDQLPLPENRTWTSARRIVFWRNSPAAVAGGVVVATPMDSADILGLDAEDGRVLWSYDYDQLPAATGRNGRNEGGIDYDVLLGADEDRIYLGSQPVSALMKPGGLRQRRGFFKPIWSVWPGPDEHVAGDLPRPVIGAEEVIIPQLGRRIVVDRATGVRQERKSVAWSERERGNVLIGQGMLFVLTNQRLHAFFDWDILLARAEAARRERPDDVAAITDHAELLLRRARVEKDDAEAALGLLARARELLEPHLRAAGGGQDPRVAEALHHCLRAVADAKLRRLDTLGAIAALQEALPLAARPIDVRDTLLVEEELYRLRQPERWRGVLAQLENHCADLPYPHSPTRDPLQWLVGESILDLEAAELRDVQIPVGLWVLFTRAEESARSRDSAAALGDLHAALERYGDRALTRSLTVGELTRDRIARRLELDPDANRNYAPFEARAGELFARALEVKDPILLKEVGRLYPHSNAAAEAARVNLDWAYEAGNAETTAELAYAALGDGPAPTEEDVQMLLKVGVVLGRSGNAAFEEGLLAWLAERHGSVRSLLSEHGGRTLAELAAEIRSAGPPPVVPEPHFDETLARARQVTGTYEWLGTVPPARVVAETAPNTIAILGRGTRLMAFSAADPTRELWSYELAFTIRSERLVLTPTRVVVGGADRVIALDAATGEVAWKHSLENAAVAHLAEEGGVLLVPTQGPGSGGTADRLRAFDLIGGLQLWNMLLDGANWLRPVCGEGRAVLVQDRWNGNTPALVVDVYRGRAVRTLDLGEGVDDKADDSAWIEDGRLILPVFSSSRRGPSRITAHDLDTGRVAWNEEIEKGLELFAVVAAEDKHYLAILAAGTNTVDGVGGKIQLLDTRLGMRQTKVSLDPGDELIGVPKYRRTVLTQPYLFIISRRDDRRVTPVKMVHLPYDVRWHYPIPYSWNELYGPTLPQPVVTDEVVAIAYTTKNRSNRMRDQAYLDLVDKSGGFKRDRFLLPKEISQSDLKLHGMGSALYVIGHRGPRSRMEIMEAMR